VKHVQPPVGAPVYSVSFASPFLGRHAQLFATHGPTIAELVVAMSDALPPGFIAHGEVRLSDHLIPRELWCWVKPKPSASGLPTYVTLHMAPAGPGGGGESGSGEKSPFVMVAALALTLATAGVASGALAAAGGIGATLTGGLFTSAGALSALGTGIGAKFLALGIGLAGSLALSALSAPPTASPTRRGQDERGAAAAQANVMQPGGPLPRVFGTYRAYPMPFTDPFYEVIDGDEFVSLGGALAGPHLLDDIRLGDANIAEAEDIEYETREGWDDDAPLTLVTRQVRAVNVSAELSKHITNPDNPVRLKDQATPANSLPKWQTMATGDAPDQFRIRLGAPGGIGISDPSFENYWLMVPLRLQGRPRGSNTWINFPEFWISGRRQTEVRGEVIIAFTDTEPSPPTAPANRGFPLAFRSVPTQSVNPIGSGGWEAHPYFGETGSIFLDDSNPGTSGVLHTHLTTDNITFYLNPNLFPKAAWEFRIRRGAPVRKDVLSTAYVYAVATYDWFGYYITGGNASVIANDDWFSDLYVIRGQSVWNEHPVAMGGDALIAVRGKNRTIENISALASGWVPDLETGDWITTSNPAHHYRDVLAGVLNKDPLPDDLVDEDALQEWRNTCDAQGYTCDALVQGEATQDVLNMLASCGFARPTQSEVWGVFEDKDRTGEPLRQIFSSRNSTNFRWERALPRLADGWRVTWPDKAANYEDRQSIVFRPGATGSNFEDVRYRGLVTEAKVLGRANFDLAQPTARGTFYYLDTHAIAIACRRGDLVGITHDVLTKRAGSARIKSKIVSGGNITGLVLDSAVEIAAGDPGFGVVISRMDGTFSAHAIAQGEGEHTTVTLVTPVPDATVTVISGWDVQVVPAVGEGAEASLVYWGPATEETVRCIVFGIEETDDGLFALTLVDEAPELVRTAAGSFDAPGSRTLSVPGTYPIIVPNYETELVVTLVGASAGAHGISNAGTFPAGTAGGDTTFDGMVAGGSPVPADRTTGGLAGSASGGDGNYTGSAGAAPSVSASGAGGDTPGIPGSGGASVGADGDGLSGAAAGAGASGARRTISGTVYSTSGTGPGGVVIKTYAPGDLVPGTVMMVEVGAAGLPGDGNSYDGGAGRTGQARFEWS